MALHKNITTQLVRASLSLFFAKKETIPIMSGPLKGRQLPKALALSNLSMLFGRYEPQVVSVLLAMLHPIKVAYDIGAHIGFMTLVLAKSVSSDGKVFAFEPAPENMAVMQQLIIQNSLQHKISLIPTALADEIGEQNLINWKSSSMYFLESALDGQNVSHSLSLTVPTCTLDSFVFEKLNPPPDLMKIDVEGAEALVIQGSLRTLGVYSPHLVIEIHGPKNAAEVWNLLQGFNYVWWHLYSRQREIVNRRETLLSYFSKESWTHHFLLEKREALETFGPLASL
jgi:FkbM family methyltransferase